MRVAVIAALLACLAAPPALAQGAWEFLGWSDRGVRVREPNAQGGWPSQRVHNLPAGATVITVQDGQWVLMDLPGLGRRQVHINDVRIRPAGNAGCVVAGGQQQRSAGSQGLNVERRPCP
jgi:hypothetical protein